MRKRKKKPQPLPKVRCPKWHEGICTVFAAPQTGEGRIVYCPRPRAENCGPGECCHHPLFTIRPKLAAMKKAGVKLKRYGKKLHDPAFVDKLYAAFVKAQARRRR